MNAAHEPKTSLPEVIFVTLCLLTYEFTLGLIPIVNHILNLAVSAALQIYFSFKGLPWIQGLVAAVAEQIPAVNELPLLTAGWFVTVFLDHNPRIAKGVYASAAIAATGGTAAALGPEGAARLGEAGVNIAGAAKGGGAARAGGEVAAAGKQATIGEGATGRTLAGASQETSSVEGGVGNSGGEKQISEEAFGAEKEPWERVKETMEQLPESEREEEEEEEPVDENPLMPEKRDEEGKG
ncbi:hypothetical protein C4587_01260 [Candidatus Parcubacteria bacterium]|nr:MAG: hypothetical protein C4587_01260 [Candidatus Parcubacteria bacterium]